VSKLHYITLENYL